MDIFTSAERLMGMDETAWAHHANPWSVATRFLALPLLVLAIWSRVWLGLWSLIPILLAVGFVWLNPRIFRAPASLDSWGARAVLGERLFLARRQHAIAPHHLRASYALTALSAGAILPLVWGLWTLAPWPTIFGTTLALIGKAWFLDRMVWLHQDITQQTADGAG